MIEGQEEREDSGDGQYDERDVVPSRPDEHQQAPHRSRPDVVRAEEFTTTIETQRVLLQTFTVTYSNDRLRQEVVVSERQKPANLIAQST